MVISAAPLRDDPPIYPTFHVTGDKTFVERGNFGSEFGKIFGAFAKSAIPAAFALIAALMA
jgi:hypothetical protein